MAKNDFKAFATDRNANVMSQEEWEALPALISGFTAGKASSAQVNKVIRQASFIAAALAQFVSDKTQRDVLDNGDLPGFVELLGSGFAVEYLSRKNPFGDIKSDGTVQTAIENLGLGAGAPPIGIPFFWPSVAMPNTVIPEWSDMVFLKFNGSTFSATTYPKLALVIPSLTLPDARGE
ncbi:TPA: phage tail protein, partial [Escherichia coli]